MKTTAKFKEIAAPTSKLIGLEAERNALRYAIANGIPCLNIGETGTGKTSLVLEVCASLGLEVVRVNMNGNVTADQFVGRMSYDGTRTAYELGIAPQCMKRGAVLLVDEINMAMADVLATLYSVAERCPSLTIAETGERIIASDGFCLVATMNPSADYAGTRELSHAMRSRFGLTITFPQMVGQRLIEALAAHVPSAQPAEVVNVAQVIETASRAQQAGDISARLSLREGIAALEMLRDGMSYAQALRYAIANKLEAHEEAKLAERGINLEAGALDVSESVADVCAAAYKVKSLERKLAKAERETAKLAKVAQLVAALGDSPDVSALNDSDQKKSEA